MKKKYKGFTLESFTTELTEREWDGHTSKSYGTGQFRHGVSVQKKSERIYKCFDGESDAKDWIDIFLHPLSKNKRTLATRQLVPAKRTLERLKKLRDDTYAKITTKLQVVEARIRKLESESRP